MRVFIVLFCFISLLHISSPLGATFSHFMNIRCTFADSFLKDVFKLYDELVISSKIISFYFMAKNKEPEKISKVNDTYFIEGFDSAKKTRVIIHGFWNSHNSRINKAMKEIYLNDYQVNLIIVNYSRVSRDTCYKIVRSRVKMLGKKIAEFLDSVLGDDEWQWQNLVVVGHSLGCHTAGVAGRFVRKGRIGTILALDPAGPGFESSDSENRLQSNDADFVECIHTNGETLGLFEPICSVDFYPNFGLRQPGCNIVIRDLCSHSRSWKLFAESLRSNFTANKCESMQEIRDKIPCNGSEIIMGGDDFDAKKNINGIYYLPTNDEAPFAIN